METRQIYLRNADTYTTVDADDYEWLSKYTWHVSSQGYVRHSMDNRVKIFMHRLVVHAPSGKQVDHIDGDKLNNTKANLRFATAAQNSYNKKYVVCGTSKYVGVHKLEDVRGNTYWRAYMTHNGKSTSIGRFDDERLAALAYDLWIYNLRGEFAQTNGHLQAALKAWHADPPLTSAPPAS